MTDNTFRKVSREEISQIGEGELGVAASLLEDAARILRKIEDGRYPLRKFDSVFWRIADALKTIRDEAARQINNDDLVENIPDNEED